MAQLTTLQSAIAKCKATLTQLNTQLSALSTSAVSAGATADTSGVLDSRINAIANKLTIMAKDVSDLSAGLAS